MFVWLAVFLAATSFPTTPTTLASAPSFRLILVPIFSRWRARWRPVTCLVLALILVLVAVTIILPFRAIAALIIIALIVITLAIKTVIGWR
jgi:hypothetical protein